MGISILQPLLLYTFLQIFLPCSHALPQIPRRALRKNRMAATNSTSDLIAMGLFETLNAFSAKVRRVGFYLYVGLVFGSLGWTFFEMHRLNKQLERKREREAQDNEEPRHKRSKSNV